MMNKKMIFGLVLAFAVMAMPNMTFSMNDPLEDDVNYVDDSMLNRLDEQYLGEEEMDDRYYDQNDYDDDMDEDYMDEDDLLDEDLGSEEDEEEEEELPEQDEVFEVTEMMPQSEVNDADDAMM